MQPTVPARFRRRVLAHAVSASAIDDYPLILVIQGAPGDGKSFQTHAVLTTGGFTPIRMSSATLSGTHESDSIARFKDFYMRAEDIVRTNPHSMPALLLEDLDTSPLGRRTDTHYTVNSQLLAGFIMNLVEDVTAVAMDTSRRFPIFVTGNDLEIIHGPLLRSGRADIFTWSPTAEERIEMIGSTLMGTQLSRKEMEHLAKEFANSPISSFAAAVRLSIGRYIFELYEQNPAAVPQLRELAQDVRREVGYSDLKAVMREQSSADGSPGDHRGRKARR